MALPCNYEVSKMIIEKFVKIMKGNIRTSPVMPCFPSIPFQIQDDEIFKGVFVNADGEPEIVTEENQHLYGVMTIDSAIIQTGGIEK